MQNTMSMMNTQHEHNMMNMLNNNDVNHDPQHEQNMMSSNIIGQQGENLDYPVQITETTTTSFSYWCAACNRNIFIPVQQLNRYRNNNDGFTNMIRNAQRHC